jgi:cell division protein FtsL
MKIDLEKAKGFVQQHARHLLLLFVAVLLVHDVFGTHGFLAMRRKQQEIEKVRAEMNRLNKENTSLQQDVKDLRTDPQTIERIAREELGQARRGEVIIKLPAQSPSENATQGKP